MIGCLIYLSFRIDTLRLFSWIDALKLNPIELAIRYRTLPYADKLPHWILFSLPNGLWLFSYASLILYIWDNQLSRLNILWFTLIPIIALLSEFGQLLKLVPGTFDVIDIFFYLFGLIIPFIIFNPKIHLRGD